MEKEERSTWARRQPLQTQQMDCRIARTKMERAIKASYKYPETQDPLKPNSKKQQKAVKKSMDMSFDIAVIGAAGFHQTASRKLMQL
jgi:hypothetical protein